MLIHGISSSPTEDDIDTCPTGRPEVLEHEGLHSAGKWFMFPCAGLSLWEVVLKTEAVSGKARL